MKSLSKLYEDVVLSPEPNAFAMLKPGFMQYGPEFIALLKNDGWKVTKQTTKKFTRPEIEDFYSVHKDKPFYNKLCDYMITDDCLCCACYKRSKDPFGEMGKFKKKVRDQWGEDEMRNAMHSSDSKEHMIHECGIAFNACNEGKSQPKDGSVKEPKDLTLDVLKDAGYGASFMDDRSWLVVDGDAYEKVGKDKWHHSPSQEHAMTSPISSEKLFELIKKSKEVRIGEFFKDSNINESNNSDKVQMTIDEMKPNSNHEIDKLTADGIKSIIRNNEQMGYIACIVAENDDIFSIKFDKNDFMSDGKISQSILNIAKFFKETEGSPKITVDEKKAEMKIYKSTAE